MKRSIALLSALGLLTVLPATALAQDGLTVAPASVRAAGVVGVDLLGCGAPEAVATSQGFPAPLRLVPNGTARLTGSTHVVATAGTYTVTAECNGRTYTASFTVEEPRPLQWYLHPAEVEPGGMVTGGGDMHTGCNGAEITSPGFAAPLKFTRGGNFGRFSGDTTVITTPGTYTATFHCQGGTRTDTRTFTIKGTPPTTPPTTTPPAAGPAPKPKPKPVVKPKGAPETGGGGTAR